MQIKSMDLYGHLLFMQLVFLYQTLNIVHCSNLFPIQLFDYLYLISETKFQHVSIINAPKYYTRNIIRYQIVDFDIQNNKRHNPFYTLEFYGDIKKIKNFADFKILKKILITELKTADDEV